MTRRSPEERATRLRERLREALIVCGGELPRSALRLLAFGGDQIFADELDEALAGLEQAGLISSRSVAHFVGRGGSGTRVYRAVDTALAAETRKTEPMPLDLHPDDRLALLELVHERLEASREGAEANAADAQSWLRISATLIAGELDDEDVARARPPVSAARIAPRAR